MEEETKSPWVQPLTFCGVASFAEASRRVLSGYQAAVAILGAAAIVYFVESAWAPVIQRAITQLPTTGAIEHGQLAWDRTTPVRTTGSTFLWISIDPTDSREQGEGADLQLEVGKSEFRVHSLLGYVAIPYLPGYRIAVNRTELEPWWGAWHPAVIVALAITIVASLMVVWSILALIYAWPVRLIAFYADRKLSWAGSWRIGAASLLPGALFLEAAILAYAFHRINLVQLLGAGLLHVMVGWVYLLFAPFCLPRAESAASGKGRSGNPFGGSSTNQANPFSERS